MSRYRSLNAGLRSVTDRWMDGHRMDGPSDGLTKRLTDLKDGVKNHALPSANKMKETSIVIFQRVLRHVALEWA